MPSPRSIDQEPDLGPLPPPSARTEPTDEEILTVEGAWAAYDLAEREMWEEYEADPTYVNGKIYLAGEQHQRRRMDRRIRHIRLAREDERVRKAAA